MVSPGLTPVHELNADVTICEGAGVDKEEFYDFQRFVYFAVVARNIMSSIVCPDQCPDQTPAIKHLGRHTSMWNYLVRCLQNKMLLLSYLLRHSHPRTRRRILRSN